MKVHAEVHYSPAAGEAELVDSFDGGPETAVSWSAGLLNDQLANAQVDDEFTVNLSVTDKED